MHYIRLFGILSCLCLWHLGDAAPFISVVSSSRSRTQQVIGGQLRTLYDFSSQDIANDLTGKMVHTRRTNVKSDVIPQDQLSQDGNNVILLQ